MSTPIEDLAAIAPAALPLVEEALVSLYKFVVATKGKDHAAALLAEYDAADVAADALQRAKFPNG